MKFGFGGFTLKLWGEFYFLHIILSLRFFTLSDLSKMVHCPKKNTSFAIYLDMVNILQNNKGE